MFCVLNVFVCPPFLHFHTFPCKYIWLINSSEFIELPIGDWWIRFSIFPEHILGILERLHVSRKSISFSLFLVRVHKSLMTIVSCGSSMLFNILTTPWPMFMKIFVINVPEKSPKWPVRANNNTTSWDVTNRPSRDHWSHSSGSPRM